MKRKKLYLAISIVACVFLFSFSALCNQFGGTGRVDKIDVDDEDLTGLEVEDKDILVEDAADEEDENIEDGEEEPTIELEIYEGPIFLDANGVCYYRILAEVTGNPEPIIEFSKDDSNGAWGLKKVQVNLYSPEETYTLTATATNSVGSVSGSIVIEWGCEK